MNGATLYTFLILALIAAGIAVGAAIYYRRSKRDPISRQAPGSRISLSVDERFAQSDRFAGFVHEASGASIVMVELPASAFDGLQRLGNAEETFAAQGVSHVKLSR